MANDFLLISGTDQSNGLGTATAAVAGGTTQDADAGDVNRWADVAAVTYYQLSADTPAVSGAQSYNTNVGPIPMRPYAASGNNISSLYAFAYLGVKHGMFANPMIAEHGVGSTSLTGHWKKGISTSLYADEVAFINARVAEAGRNVDVYATHIGETDANTPARIASLSADWAAHMANLRADCPGMANALHVFVMVNPNANLSGDGDVAGMRAAQLAYINANATTTIGVDPAVIPVPADPHYRSSGYWSLGEKTLNAVRARLFPSLTFNLNTAPFPAVQADGPIGTTANSTTTIRPRGAAGHVGELPGVDVQVGVVTSYTASATHVMEVGAGPAGGSGSGGTGLDGGFLQLGTTTDSFSTNHREMSVWWRSVVLSAMTTDVVGRRTMPTPSIRVTGPDKNEGQIISVRGANVNNPVAGFYAGTNDAISTSLLMPKTAPGTPLQVPAGALALAVIATNGATQTITNITNPDTGAWTIHRQQIVNPGSGSVGMAIASARCNGGQLRQTTVAYGLTGINVGYVIVFNPMLPADATIDIGGETITAGALSRLLASAAIDIGGETITATGSQALGASASIDIGGEVVASSASSRMFADATIDIGSEIVTAIAVIPVPLPRGYCTPAQIEEAIGLATLIELTDFDNTGEVDLNRVSSAIQRVDGIIDSYLVKRYSTPLADPVPTSISTFSCDWAVRILQNRRYKTQSIDASVDQEKIDRAWLQGVADGRIGLGAQPYPAKSLDTIDKAGQRDTYREFSLRRMKGFI